MNYLFNESDISQHFIRYGLDMRPAITAAHDRRILQDYANWLIDNFNDVFESLIVKPNQLQVQKRFNLPTGKSVEVPTFMMTPRGPVFVFPKRLFIDKPADTEIGDTQKILLRAVEELAGVFADKQILRLGVVNEFVFDTGKLNSTDIVSRFLANSLWQKRVKNLNIRVEIPTDKMNVNIEIKPASLRKSAGRGVAVAGNVGFGIVVTLDVNNRIVGGKLSEPQIREILAFSEKFVRDEFIRFLNGEG